MPGGSAAWSGQVTYSIWLDVSSGGTNHRNNRLFERSGPMSSPSLRVDSLLSALAHRRSMRNRNQHAFRAQESGHYLTPWFLTD